MNTGDVKPNENKFNGVTFPARNENGSLELELGIGVAL